MDIIYFGLNGVAAILLIYVSFALKEKVHRILAIIASLIILLVANAYAFVIFFGMIYREGSTSESPPHRNIEAEIVMIAPATITISIGILVVISRIIRRRYLFSENKKGERRD